MNYHNVSLSGSVVENKLITHPNITTGLFGRLNLFSQKDVNFKVNEGRGEEQHYSAFTTFNISVTVPGLQGHQNDGIIEC